MIGSEYKFPPAFVEQMENLLGEEAKNFFDSLQTELPVSIRINPGKKSSSEIEKVRWCESGGYLNSRPIFTLDPLFHAGTYYVQEASSMFLEQAVLQTGLCDAPIRALDLCAAPGGKSTHLLSILHGDSLLVANEVIRTRVPVLKENIIKWGHANCFITNNDPKDFSALENYFDLVMCDAPCSGEGLFRKDKNAINEWSEEQVEMCSLRQQRIVHDVWPSLKPGGFLIYATCTYNEKENEDNINRFCNELNAACIELNISSFDGVVCNRKEKAVCYHFYPHKIKGEGFCISVLRKDAGENISPQTKIEKFDAPEKKHLQKISSWFSRSDDFEFIKQDDKIFMFDKKHLRDYFFLKRNLKIKSAGTCIAVLKGNDVQPAPELAWSNYLNTDSFSKLHLSKTDALKYLKGATDFNANGDDGFRLMMYENTPLGFSKKTGKRLNNLYPKEWYIRMDIST